MWHQQFYVLDQPKVSPHTIFTGGGETSASQRLGIRQTDVQVVLPAPFFEI
jgi:hypothetical protein